MLESANRTALAPLAAPVLQVLFPGHIVLWQAECVVGLATEDTEDELFFPCTATQKAGARQRYLLRGDESEALRRDSVEVVVFLEDGRRVNFQWKIAVILLFNKMLCRFLLDLIF